MNRILDRPVTADAATSAIPLPLNLIALIISFLDEQADLARACRTCRVLHYMTLPQLYSSVSLRSYDHIRYTDGKAHGCGGPSPFFMALNALITRNVAGWVKQFKVYGEWKDNDLEECARVGRVPDNNMMLNTLVRAVVDRMPALESFTWELNTKMLPTIWLGLAARPTLQSITVQFPSSRHPQPLLLVPPMANLSFLRITNIDPLCYPDDISELIYGSKNLRHLQLHFNPRMRNAREPSTSVHTYFGRSLAAGYKIPLKSLVFQNLYAAKHDQIVSTLLDDTLEDVTLLSSAIGTGDSADYGFVDHIWQMTPPEPTKFLRTVRGDKISRIFADMLGKFQGLERYYLVTGRVARPKAYVDSMALTPKSNSSEGCALAASASSPASSDAHGIALGDRYLDNICRFHGATLRHLLLMPQWRLNTEKLTRLVHSCPNLEQLGFGMEKHVWAVFRLLLPFLKRLYAFRSLDYADSWLLSDYVAECGEEQMALIGYEAVKWDYRHLRWVGLGEAVFEVLEGCVPVEGGDGVVPTRREVRRRGLEAVEGVEIWRMDRLEI